MEQRNKKAKEESKWKKAKGEKIEQVNDAT